MICNDLITGKMSIYKITNLINGKIYIGRSSDLKARKSKHKTKKNNTMISRAIQKYR
jgi:predicted GIY-YIG superfamily endonuclease